MNTASSCSLELIHIMFVASYSMLKLKLYLCGVKGNSLFIPHPWHKNVATALSDYNRA